MREGLRHRQVGRDFEQRENWKRAIEAYELALEADRKARKDVDAALCNRLGDLYRRTGDINKAVYYYDRAADGHLAAGFYNNAIALCNKILRNQPNRHSAHLKLGKIGAAKGFLSDARRHFLEYAERMQRANKVEEAFSALIEFANISGDPEIRLMIADQLFEHKRQPAAVEELRLAWRDMRQLGRDRDAEEVRDRILQVAPDRDPEADPPEESTAVASDVEGVVDLPEILPYDEPEPQQERRPGPSAEDLGRTQPKAEYPDQPAELEVYGTGLIDEEAADRESFEYDAGDSEGEDEPIEFLPTALEDPDRLAELAREDQVEEGLEVVPTNIAGSESASLADADFSAEGLEIVPTEVADVTSEAASEDESVAGGAEDIDLLPTALDRAEGAVNAAEDDTATEEVLELAPTAIGETEVLSAPPEPVGTEAEEDYERDAWQDEVEAAMVQPPDWVEPDEPVVAPADRIRELELQLERSGAEPELLIALAEALLETGERERAVRHLGEAAEAYQSEGRYEDARRVAEELLQVDVNDVRAYQKRVELALMAKDREGLISAYLDLADCLDRTDATDKARIVIARVLEIDPANRRARQALELIGSEEKGPGPSEAAATKPSESGDYVDLRSLVVEEQKAKAKSTRFRVPAADPQSEADVNFAEMLKQFKSMVADTIEKEDSSSHYDLGCAYRDMGLIDEAIAEFQIAARNPEYRLRAIENLGSCFAEKGEHRIAVKVLLRALQVPGYKDEDLIEVFYAMGRSYEELGDSGQAVEWYERVMGCDVRFKDASQRATSLRR
jgi:tetratricopeptide (TPR) repeat protein